MTPAAVHVSIHDVAPPFRAQVEAALAMTREAGARPALLVVPDFHGEAPIGKDASFCAWLRGLQGQGHEVYLHGFIHRAGPSREPRGMKESVARYFAQRVVSDGEAEMSDLSQDEGAERLDAGERALEEAGLRTDGYVAPAWSMPAWLVPMLAARAYAYTEDHGHVYSPRDGRKRASLVLNYASRTPGRLFASVAFCRVATPLGAILPARIAIHPADMAVARLAVELRRLLGWGKGRFVGRGRDLLA